MPATDCKRLRFVAVRTTFLPQFCTSMIVWDVMRESFSSLVRIFLRWRMSASGATLASESNSESSMNFEPRCRWYGLPS